MNLPGSPVTYISCDGGCRGNSLKPNVGGYGVYIECYDRVVEKYGGVCDTTNNAMEILACIEALRITTDKKMPVIVYSDSMYMIRGITEWCYGWIKRDWINSKGGHVANKDLWLQLISEVHKFDTVKFIHCKGHAEHEGNNRADELANQAMDIVQFWLSQDLHTL